MSTPSDSQIAMSRASLRGYCVKSDASLNCRGLTKIVATVVALSSRARRISARCPSCSQPIVVTRPTGRATSASASRSSALLRTTRVEAAGCGCATPETLEVAVERDTRQRHLARGSIGGAATQRLVEDGIFHADRLLVAREGAGCDIGGVGTRRLADGGAQVRVGSSVPRHEVAEAEQVRDDLDLAAAHGAGADADRRDPESVGDGPGELRRHELENDREGAGLLDGQRVGEQCSRL